MHYFTAKFTRTQCDPENYGTTILKVIGDWQVGCKDIKSRMVNLYYSDNWTDCTFRVGAEQLVPAHRIILASASPVFATMFFGGLPESDKPIHVEDIRPDTFTEMLRYIYTDNMDIISFNDACALYYAAKKYMLLPLKTQCLEFMIKKLTPEDCCSAYEFAQMFEENDLLKACEKLMETKTLEVLNSSSFLDASLETIKFIYSMDDLAIESELDLFAALDRYAKAKNNNCDEPDDKCIFIKKQISGPSEDNTIEPQTTVNESPAKNSEESINAIFKDCMNSEVKDKKTTIIKTETASLMPESDENEDRELSSEKEEEGVTIRDVLKLIRFLTMTAEDFTKLPVVSTLLTQSEMVAVLINIIQQAKSLVPMPEGFSNVVVKRIKLSPENDVATRKIIKFRFTVPECNYLEEDDEINFPQVHCLNYSWKLNLNLSNNECLVYMCGTGPQERDFVLRIGFVTREGVSKPRKFSTRSCSADEMGSLGNWDEIIDKYLEDGALCFDVQIKPIDAEKVK